ncbi:MAG: magnesium transporter [Chloroflexi bacterium]|nr:magnesium transporter [Chloroflexota bacterium]
MLNSPRPSVDQTFDQIREALDHGSVDAAIRLLEQLKQADKVDVFDELDVEDQAELLPRLTPEESADLMVELDQEDQADIAERIDDTSLSRILDEMEPDDAADVIGDLPEQRQVRVLAGMSEADDVRPLLIHPDESAGGLMTTSFITLRPAMTAQAAIDALREWSPDAEMTYYLFVVDRDRKLVGVVSLRQLITAPANKLISDIMDRDVITVPAGTDQEQCANLLREHNLLALPVVDANGVLLGVITYDDLVDVIEEEATEDVYRLGGVPDEDYPLSPVTYSLRRRLPWLYINLVTAFLAAWVVSLFESTIAQVAILAALQSIVAGQGGNAATQVITIMVRGIATGDVTRHNALKALGKEALQGLFQGLAVALIVGAGVALWQGNPVLGLVIGVAMVGNLVVAGVAGALVPLGLRVVHIDPALASSVIVTTFTDCCGFAFALGLATLLINYLR